MTLCGIDEAGRGPIAGPLCVVGCMLQADINGLRDSKKLSEKKREMLFAEIMEKSLYHIVWHSADDIDSHGLSYCLSRSLQSITEHINAQSYLFDGNCTFGVDGIQTMIKADNTIDAVMAASILAKVSRDRYMKEMALVYPQYGFSAHKGYPTAAHVTAIETYGLSPIHRRSFHVPSKKH